MSMITSAQRINYLLFILCILMTIFKSIFLGRTFHGMFIFQIVYAVSAVLHTLSYSGLAIQSHFMFKKWVVQNQCEVDKDCYQNVTMILSTICSICILIVGMYMSCNSQYLKLADGKRKLLKGIYLLLASILKITIIPAIFSFSMDGKNQIKIINVILLAFVILFHFAYLKGLIIVNAIRNHKKIILDVMQFLILILTGIILIVAKTTKVQVLFVLVPIIIVHFISAFFFYFYIILPDFKDNRTDLQIIKKELWVQIAVIGISNILLIMTISFLFGYESRLIAVDLDFVMIGLAIIIEVIGTLLILVFRLCHSTNYVNIILAIEDRQSVPQQTNNQTPIIIQMNQVQNNQFPSFTQLNQKQITIQIPDQNNPDQIND